MKGIMKFKKLAAFVLLAAVLVGMVPEHKARAENEYYTIYEAMDMLGITNSAGLNIDTAANGFPYCSYMFYKVYDADNNFVKFVLFMSQYGYFDSYSGSRRIFLNIGGYVPSSNTGNNFFIELNNLVQAPRYNWQLDNMYVFDGCLYEIVYANFDTSFLSGSGYFIDIVNDDLNNISHVHVWTDTEQPATCTTPGRSWEECACGEIQNETEVPALGHSWEPKEEPGSCTTDSRTWEECSLCSAVQNEVVTPSDGHVWLDKEEPATCTTSGRSWQECACGEVQNDTVLPAFGHSWEQKEQTGNCAVDSKTWEECSLCSAIQNEVVTPASGHVYDDDDDNVCNVCYYNRNIERLGDFLDMLPKILTLFCIFPLNIYLIINLVVLGVILYRSLKKK